MLTLKNEKRELYQWDFSVKATVNVNCNEVHFSETLLGDSMTVLVNDGEVEIPNQLLTSAKSFYCWAFVINSGGGYTIAQKKFDVRQRPKPSDYVYTETEVKTIETVVEKALQEALSSGDFKGEKGDAGVGIVDIQTIDGRLHISTSDGKSYVSPDLRGTNGEDGFSIYESPVHATSYEGYLLFDAARIKIPHDRTLKEGDFIFYTLRKAIYRVDRLNYPGVGVHAATFLTDLKGENGADGVGIKSIQSTNYTEDGATNTVAVNTTDGNTYNFYVKNGSKGSQGVQGLQGAKGDKGDKGDRGEQGIQGVQGEKGEKGDQGIQGIQGVAGEPFGIYRTYPSIEFMGGDFYNVPQGKFVMIASNVDDPDNAKLFVRTDYGFSFVSDLSGSQGIQGERGEQGLPGEKGDKGDKGDQGIQGLQGIPGQKGDRGEKGEQGVPGEKGEKGTDGVSATHAWNGTILTITSASGTSSANLKGENGNTIVTLTNVEDFILVTGGIPANIIYERYGYYLTDKDTFMDTGTGVLYAITEVVGNSVPTLYKVESIGTLKGADGVGIKSVTQTTTSSVDGGSNVITVTKTDGTTSTFTVKNGSKGSKGDTGEKGDKGEKGDTGAPYTLNDTDKASIAAAVKASLTTETWTFKLKDGSTVTKKVVLA